MATSEDTAVVLFDSTCVFCMRAVTFIAKRDPAAYFRFGASQSPEAARLLASYDLTRETARSIILIEQGRVYLRSTATLRIARRMSWPWSMAAALLVVPAPLRDVVYRCVAAVRQRLSRRLRVCGVPSRELRDRMIGNEPQPSPAARIL